MRIISWNVHGARKDSPLWDALVELQPDIALLQEIGSIPNSVTDRFDQLTRQAVNEDGKPQRFRTGVFVKGRIVEELALSSMREWVNREIEFFGGNFISCTVQPNDYDLLKVVCVYSPHWPVDKRRLEAIDVSEVKTRINPNVWGTDLLWDALRNTIASDDQWAIGGDFNSSETFDCNWQDRNNRRFGIRSSGNAEMLERMRRLGLTECLRRTENDPIVPTFRHSRGGVYHQMDHLFVSSTLCSRLNRCIVGDQAVIFGKSLSDHLPIIADFQTVVLA
jgi:exonuclease III